MEYMCDKCGHKFVGDVLFFGAITCPKCGNWIRQRSEDLKIDMR